MVELLLQNGADINAVNSNNNSALILALDTGRGNHFVNSWNFLAKEALFIFFCLGYEEIAKLLIRKGADVNIVGQDDNTGVK